MTRIAHYKQIVFPALGFHSLLDVRVKRGSCAPWEARQCRGVMAGPRGHGGAEGSWWGFVKASWEWWRRAAVCRGCNQGPSDEAANKAAPRAGFR